MNNQWIRGRARRCALALCLFLFTAVLAVSPVWAGEGKEAETAFNYGLGESSIAMEVTYGFDNTAKGGRYAPVKIELANQKGTGFSGRIQILSMESDYEIYQYEYPVTVEGEDTASLAVNIPLGSRADQLFVFLVNDSGQKVGEKRLKLNGNPETTELFIGILSDYPEKLDYLNGVGVSYSALKTRTFPLNQETFPETAIELDLMDVLVVSGFRLRNLSEIQTRAMMEWVRAGGVLVLGTGARVDDTLGRFAPELLDDSYDMPEKISVNMGLEYASAGPVDASIDLVCADVSLAGGNEIFSDDQLAILSSVGRGKGLIGVAAYDFADIADFCRQNPSYVDKFFKELLGENRINSLAAFTYTNKSPGYWNVRNMINSGDVNRLPRLSIYALEIIIYILLAGPGLYIFLKQRNMRQFYRTGVILLSLFFTANIYFMGNKTRFDGLFYNYARFVDASEDAVKESAFINIRSPYSRAYAMDLNPAYSVRPVTRNYYYEAMMARKQFTGNENFQVSVSYEAEKTRIEAQKVVAFEPKYFQMEKTEDNLNHVGFTGQIRLFEGKLSGTITNNFAYTVENTALLLYGRMVLLGEMQAGETKDLSGLELINIPLNHNYVTAEVISGGSKFVKTDIENQEYLDCLEKTNILQFYMDNYMTSYANGGRVVGFVRGVDDVELMAYQEYDHDGLTAVTSAIDVNTMTGRLVSRPALMRTPKIVSGQYDVNSNSIYGLEPVVVEYSLGNDITVQKLRLEQVSERFLNNEKYGYLTGFSGNIYFYNNNTGVFDQLASGKEEYSAGELSDYLSPSNTLTVKYLADNTSDYSWNILLPMLSVTGEER